MAFTIDSNTLNVVGNHWQVSGTYETNSSGTTEAIFPSGSIIEFNVTRNEDDKAGAIPYIRINTSHASSGAVANGTIFHNDEVNDKTQHWTATFTM